MIVEERRIFAIMAITISTIPATSAIKILRSSQFVFQNLKNWLQ